nr:MAG TPA: hypothetical protein [Caudoviricetes sp.]
MAAQCRGRSTSPRGIAQQKHGPPLNNACARWLRTTQRFKAIGGRHRTHGTRPALSTQSAHL